MDEKRVSLFVNQLRAMLKRNLLLKSREKRRTSAEIFLPMYSLGVLVFITLLIPNPNFPEMSKAYGDAKLFEHFQQFKNHTVAVVPNNTEILRFLEEVNILWLTMHLDPGLHPINWLVFDTHDDLLATYWRRPSEIPIAVVFENEDPINGPLKYKIRTNPTYFSTPPTSSMYSSPATCRQMQSHWSGIFPIETGDSCPINQYYYSGFTALQALLDYTKIRLDSSNSNIQVPMILLEMFPKKAYTGNWLIALRLIIPLYMVMGLSQCITYLLILIVGEKEKKIKEGMKIMGLKDSVFWLSWFIIYGSFVLFLSIISCGMLFALNVYKHSNIILIFLLTFLYSLSVVMFAFMITPFFDKSRTAGIVGNFAVNLMSLLYFIQVFVNDSSSIAFWIISLISSTGFALAMDKALVLDMAGHGINFKNMWDGPGIPFAGSIIMMLADIILYGLLAFYLDNVIPSEHGTKKSPFFCLKPSFWCPTKRKTQISVAVSETYMDNDDSTAPDVEPIPRELKGREAIKIVDLHKTFSSCRGPQINAVNGINLTIYEGQITAILGHNGAGKTTLFNILTGLTAPTAGTAYIFGYDIRNPSDMQSIRNMTGVCPQHDILFDLLTPREHLLFFAAVRGISPELVQLEVKKTLQDIDLSEKADTYVKYLSGGQKRKLSVGIAVIGDPKIIILDEPTAGVDPYSRRHLWSILQNRRHGKVILLTTHFMDEADILSDRKAVVSKGKLRCCGTSLFLKNKFGIGYHLTLVLDGTYKEYAINRLINSHVPKAERARRHGRELSFILPHNTVDHFADLFEAIEREIINGRLGISSYGVSMTTLEEVFLHLEKVEEEEVEIDDFSKKLVRERAISRSLSLQSKTTSYHSLQNEGEAIIDGSVNKSKSTTPILEEEVDNRFPNPSLSGLGMENIKTNPNFTQTLITLLRLRSLRLLRDVQKLYVMIALPVLIAALGLYINSSQQFKPTMKSLILNGETYNQETKFIIHNASQSSIDNLNEELYNSGVSEIWSYDGNFSKILEMAPSMTALNINIFTPPNISIVAAYNDTTQHSLPIILNLISNAIFRILMEDNLDNWQPIQVTTHPFQQTSQPEAFNISACTTAVLLGMIFVLVPTSLAIDMVNDREIQAKNQLRVNGLSFILYFLPYFIVLLVIMFVIAGALLALILLFDFPSLRETSAFGTLGILIFFYCPSSILFATCISYIFDKTDTAQSFLPNIATFTGLIPFVIVMGLDMLHIGGQTAFILHVIFSLVDPLYLPYAIVYFVNRVHLICQLNSACIHLTFADYYTDEIIVMIVAIIIQIPIFALLLMVVDVKKNGGKLNDVIDYILNNKRSSIECEIENNDISEFEDNDVKAERQKVTDIVQSNNEKPVVLVQNLRKEYNKTEYNLCPCTSRSNDTSTDTILTASNGFCGTFVDSSQHKLALRNLSLSVDAGEVFGLLGHNGAGKTTTMRILIAEEAATCGSVQIGGYNINSNTHDAFQVMGYCPQHDALWKNITVREHLECYAAIRGVPDKDISKLISLYMEGLQIGEHANKQAQHCSGGTRRKLSFAMAMVGGPKVVLMDEPSTGMDPRSKRFLWDTILASFQGQRGAILTTHSMEEADALCSRVGIMVKGELRCIGSTQHLKNLYGAGYTLEMKLSSSIYNPNEATTPSSEGQTAREFVEKTFPDASLKESFADRLVYSIPQQSVASLAQCFKQLEKAKIELDIEEYSFSQTTLEQVFLKFAQYDEINNET